VLGQDAIPAGTDGNSASEFLLIVLLVGELAVVEVDVGLHVEVAVAA
jgi:hypothetical protein